jgi:hypothetical protein
MHRLTYLGFAASCVALSAPGQADAQNRDPFLLAQSDDWEVRARVEAGINLVAEHNLFWEFAETVAGNSDFDSDGEWAEFYVKPGIAFKYGPGDRMTLYGAASVVVSTTVGTDAFAASNTGQATVEELYLGLRHGDEKATRFDVSFGAREWKAGTGMLLSNGGSNGFSRGALKLGPRRAWRVAGLATVASGGVSGTAFYLDPNEAPDNDTGTHIAGVDVRFDANAGSFFGMTIGKVLSSTSPYPQAPPGGIGVPNFIIGGRDGLRFFSAYGRIAPTAGPLENAWVGLDLAIERNERIDLKAWAGRAQIGYTFARHRWRPSISYVYQTFSGDDPNTPQLERFDPLYYEGNPSAWSTGTKSSMMFINSNVNAHQLVLSVVPSARDTITLRAARISANQLRSPIQFGQATRVEFEDGIAQPITGVTRKHLSDDLYLEYRRVVTPNVYFTAGVSLSSPGAGVDSISNDLTAPIWTGGFVNVVVNF